MATSDPTATNLQDRVASAVEQLEEVYQSLLHVDSLAAVLDGALGAASDDNCHFQFHVRSMKKIAQEATETIDRTRIELGGSHTGGRVSADQPACEPEDDDPAGLLQSFLKRWHALPQLKRAELVGIATRWAAAPGADTELDRRYADLTLPDVVGHVLYGYQNKLWQARGIVACALAVAEDEPEDSRDIRYSLEAALDLMTPVIERLETGSLSRDAAKRELADLRPHARKADCATTETN